MAAILDVYKGTNGNQYSDWATSSYGDVMGQLFYYLSVDSTTCSIYIGGLSVLAKKSNNYSAATTGHWRWRTYHSNPNTSYPSSSTLYTDSTNRSISTSYARLDNGTANTYTPAFTINANALSWNNTYTEGTFTISGRVVKPSGTSNADTDSRQATPSQTIKLHLNEISWPQKDVTKTLNYSSSDQFVTTIAEPTGGSGSFTYTLTGDTGYLYLSGRNIYAKGGTSYLTGYSNKQVSVVVKDKYTGRDIAQDVGVVVTVTMKPAAVTLKYNHNGGSFSSTATRPSRYNTSEATIESRQVNGTAYDKWIETIPITTTHWNLYNLDNTYWGVVRTGYHIDTTKAWNTKADGTGYNFHQDDTSSNTTNCVTTKRLNSGTEITNNKTITLYANWQPNTYTVVYNANGGSGSMSNSSFSYGGAGNLRANAFNAPSGNYEFGGWATSVANATAGTVHRANQAAHGNLSTTNGDTVNLYAIWKRTINFYSGLSKAKNTTRTQYYDGANSKGANITTPTATDCTNIDGWTELGWRNDTTAGAKETNFNTSIAPDSTVYYAVYSRTLTMTYANGGGTGTAPSNTTVTQYYNSNPTISSPSITLAANTFSKAGYNFTGWDKGAAGANYTWSIAVGGTDITRTAIAQWTACKVTIRYNVNGGTIPTGTGETRYRVSSDGLVQKSTNSGGSWTTYTTVVKITDTYKDILNVNNTNIGLHRIGHITIADKAWNLNASGTGNSFNQADSEENTTNKVTTKRLNGGTEITSDKIITLYANWQFRGSYIYKNDTNKWVKVVPFVYDGSTWRETQPFVYTSNGWKSLIN